MKFLFRAKGKQEVEETKQILPTEKNPKPNPSSEEVISTQIGFDIVQFHENKKHLNAKSWNDTPSGKLQLGNLIQSIGDEIETGQEYIVEITKVPA